MSKANNFQLICGKFIASQALIFNDRIECLNMGVFIMYPAQNSLVLNTKIRKERLNGHCVIKKIMKEGVTMSKAKAKFSEVKELLMKDEEFKAEYEKLKPRYEYAAWLASEQVYG